MNRIVVLENIRSLHNVGSIFRTSDGAGFDALFLCGYTGTPPDRRIEKVSLGAENFIKWQHFNSAKEAVLSLKAKGFTIYAIEQTSRSQNILNTKSFIKTAKQSIAVVFGNEVEGISAEVLELCDEHLEIPMKGKKSSLNVSIAAGIALYQF